MGKDDEGFFLFSFQSFFTETRFSILSQHFVGWRKPQLAMIFNEKARTLRNSNESKKLQYKVCTTELLSRAKPAETSALPAVREIYMKVR